MDINDRTKIPLFAVMASMPVLAGGLVWLSVIYFKADAAEQYNIKQDLKIETQMSLLLDIRDRVIRIEEKQRR